MDISTKKIAIFVILLKVCAISFIVFNDDSDIFYFGEKQLVGQKKDLDKPENEKSEEIPDINPTSRKSFIDDLLYLPQLNTDHINKEEISKYLSLIDRKKAQLESRMSTLKERENKLKSLENHVEGKVQKLDEEMMFFQQTLQKEKEIAKERLKKLLEFYTKVPPKKSAPVFEELDKDLVVALFNGLPKKLITQILSLMNPQKSVELTEYYGRLRSAKEYVLLKEINSQLSDEFQKCKKDLP